jgi:tetratricopeptide (TPR) repeat protein
MATEVVVPQGDRLWQKRVFANSPDCRFEGRVHEQLVHPVDWPIVRTRAEIRHWGYADGAMARLKGQRNLELLIGAPETSSGDFYHLYQLGRTLFNLRYFKEAEDGLLQAVKAGLEEADPSGPSDRTDETNATNATGRPNASRGFSVGTKTTLAGRAEPPFDWSSAQSSGGLFDRSSGRPTDRPSGRPSGRKGAVNPSLWNHALILLSQVHQRLGRTEEAEEDLALLVKLKPAYGPAKAFLGKLLYENGRLKECVPCLKQALALGCGDPGWGADPARAGFTAACQLAKASEKLGDLREAGRAWREAIRCNPESPEPWVALAELSLKAGRSGQAKDLLEKAMRLAPAHRRAKLLEASL